MGVVETPPLTRRGSFSSLRGVGPLLGSQDKNAILLHADDFAPPSPSRADLVTAAIMFSGDPVGGVDTEAPHPPSSSRQLALAEFPDLLSIVKTEVVSSPPVPVVTPDVSLIIISDDEEKENDAVILGNQEVAGDTGSPASHKSSRRGEERDCPSVLSTRRRGGVVTMTRILCRSQHLRGVLVSPCC